MAKDKMFVPTNHIINDMFIKLQIHEQLNSIIFGPTYEKHHDFFNSEEFKNMVYDIASNENQYSLIAKKVAVHQTHNNPNNEFDNIYLEEEKSMMMDINNENDDSYKFKNNLDYKFWESKIIDFLTKSNEKWILDQYKLVKQYLLENSIESHITQFKHPVYNYYNGIEGLKSFFKRIKGDVITNQPTELDRSSSSEDENVNLNRSAMTIPEHALDSRLVRLKVKK